MVISLLSCRKHLLDLNKPRIHNFLQKKIDKVIAYELNKLDQPRPTLSVLRNILEVFNDVGDQEFCEHFLKKIQNVVHGISIPKFDLSNEANSSQCNNFVELKPFIESALSERDKLDDLKKFFSSIEANQTDKHNDPLHSIAAKAYEKVQRSYEGFDKYIVDLGNNFIEPNRFLGRIANKPAAKNMFEFLDKVSIVNLLEAMDDIETGTETIADDTPENPEKKMKVDHEHTEGVASSDHIEVNINLSPLGSGGVEECRGQG